MSALISEAWAQRTVTGTVTSQADNEGLPGVTVRAKGSSVGVNTDFEGNYRLEVPEGSNTLVFSFVGFTTQEVEIGNRSVIDVSLAEDVKQLKEIVVTGFGIKRAANEVTYQTERVDSETLIQAQPQNAAQGLTGKVAGLQINVQNNGVNPQTQILLRGLRSISANNEAMVVIDGSVSTIGAFNNLNPQDIESVNVLKGPSAGALYGSRAANGAVIVTTKKGRIGEAFTVGINSSMTFEEVSYLPDFQSEYGIGWAGHYDRIENTNWGPRFDGVSRPIGPSFPAEYPLDDQVVPYAPIKDNLRDFYDIGSTLQNTVYFSGGDETSTYYLSAGRVDTKGIVPEDEYARNTFRVNATKTLGKLTLGLNSSYFEDETNVVGDRIGDQERPLYWFVLNTPANIPLSSYSDWQNPASYAHANNYYNAYYQNPYWGIGTTRETSNTNRLNANITADYEITDWLSLSGQLGANRQATQGKNWRDAQTYDPDLQPAAGPVTSFLEDTETQFAEYNGNVLLNGNFKIGEDFTLRPIVGAQFLDTQSRYSRVRANNLSIPGFYDISNGTGSLVGNVSEYRKRTIGVFTDITLGYREWAYLNVGGRQDYTSTLPLDDNSYFYPQASLSLVLSEAIPVLTDNNFLSDVKVTASRAIVYNDLDVYALNERYSQPAFFPFGTTNGFELGGVTVDENIGKEKLDTYEFGLTLGFLRDRFSLTSTYFTGSTTDLITSTTPSVASGATTFLTNIGELSSSGLELSLSGLIVQAGDFRWNINANYTSYETVVEEIKDDLTEIILDNYGTYGTAAIVGQAFPQIKASSYVRDPQGRVVVDAGTGNPLVGPVVAMGKATPDYILGLTNRFSFKGISVGATLDYRTGHVYYSQGSDAMEFTGRSPESVSANRQDFVFPNSVIETEEGVYAENTIPVTDGVMGFWQNTYNDIKENYVKDATALKLREVAVNYTLPESLLSRTGFVKRLTVGFVGRNLVTVLANQSNFSDPEFRNTRMNRTTGRPADDVNGIGIGGYQQSPPTRSYGFNVNIEF